MTQHKSISADHLWSAIRGLGLFGMADMELADLRGRHLSNNAFASRAIVLAVDQVRAVRISLSGVTE
ncbi:hypothetical protein UFOVP233_48 [uncultured Caudovirales phage]|uniref:Uncharacterized protein n=1 Tax=uncultured Caudovirales phage TaxID=2100421 RepID=A0A6J7WQZ3_9CAUD|nr:hypothetical protein UFOVP233_48 [uncultured Caudovirales phage]